MIAMPYQVFSRVTYTTNHSVVEMPCELAITYRKADSEVGYTKVTADGYLIEFKGA